MYTGEMIDQLIEEVQSAEQIAEQIAFVHVTEAKRPMHATSLYNTFIYDFARNQGFEVA